MKHCHPEYFLVEGEKVINSVMAETLNNYFVNIGKYLASSLAGSPTNLTKYLDQLFVNSFSLFPTDPKEIVDLLGKFGNKSSFVHDLIPLDIHVVNKSINFIAPQLAAVVNCLFRNGFYPDVLKIAKVCPVYKHGTANTISNYCSITLLPCFSKIFEKAMYCRLDSYIASKNILTSSQYDLRQKHSTYVALLDIYNKISGAIDNRDYSIGNFY